MKRLTDSEREGLIYSLGEYEDLSHIANWEEIQVKLKVEDPELANAIEKKIRGDHFHQPPIQVVFIITEGSIIQLETLVSRFPCVYTLNNQVQKLGN
ncbi:hypothetical protein VIBNISFn27_p10189 [Vibrio nigripulchritudo SFn27]|uniref:Uncharacterized protein n=1 Tax=Vibrio nigripulchritudo TaxID=28173 RepID=A0A9P1JLC1_9VIBR|nr:hypothetical protein [Vibrio nigripulchritudo]CBJ93204.1 Protein of unknown function [Vibrio nigripulchritudo]CCN92015.1 hypothetical protein VIBNISFn27_p10189 [Vibrio nigripulchritudo SFn27]CCO44049.1 hypothetical protein VIBNISFn135_p10189 [Vibrio nigripulchritudo SFn135]